MRKVLLIGPYPPPFGGLAVQLCQWQQYLATNGTYQCEVLNIGEGRATPTEGCLPVTSEWHFVRQVVHHGRQGSLLHLLTNGHNRKSWLSCLVCAAAGLLNNRRTVLVLGSGNTAAYLAQAGFMGRMTARCAIMLAGHVICRNEATQRALMQLRAQNGQISIMPGFLGVGHSSGQPLPDHVQQFINDHDPVLGATASIDSEYGIPTMLALVERLRSDYARLGLIIMGPTRDAVHERYGAVPEQILVAGPLPHDAVIGTMERLRVFLRPTAFDGDSVSVREALAIGIPVVASNVGLRPKGVAVFPVGDMSAFLECVTMALTHPHRPAGRSTVQSSTTPERLLDLYAKLFCHQEGSPTPMCDTSGPH